MFNIIPILTRFIPLLSPLIKGWTYAEIWLGRKPLMPAIV